MILFFQDSIKDKEGNPQTPEFPTHYSGKVKTLYGQEWSNWYRFLKKEGSGLQELAQEWVAEQALKYLEQNGELPTKDSGALIDYPKIKWGSVDEALSNMKGIIMSLDICLVKAGLKEGFDGVLSEDFILKHMLLHIEEHKELPPRRSEVETVPGQKWENWETSLVQCLSGIKNKSSLMRLFHKWIKDQAQKHEKETGDLPTKDSGALTDHPKITWSLLDKILLSRGAHAMSLDTCFVKADLKEGFDGNLSIELITEHMVLHLKKNRKLPGRSDDVETIYGQKWQNWNGFLKGKQSSLSNLYKNWVVDQAIKYKKATGKLPTTKSGALIDYPELDWKLIDDSFPKTGRNPVSLETCLVNAGLKKGFDGKITKDIIVEHMVLFLKKSIDQEDGPKFPTSHSGDVENLPDQNWGSWHAFLKRSGAGGLLNICENWIMEQALKHQEKTKKLPTKNSGALVDYPDLDWALIDQACKNRGNKVRTTLEEFFIKKGFIRPPDNASDHGGLII